MTLATRAEHEMYNTSRNDEQCSCGTCTADSHPDSAKGYCPEHAYVDEHEFFCRAADIEEIQLTLVAYWKEICAWENSSNRTERDSHANLATLYRRELVAAGVLA